MAAAQIPQDKGQSNHQDQDSGSNEPNDTEPRLHDQHHNTGQSRNTIQDSPSPSRCRRHRRKHHHHRSAARYSTSRSPLRGRRRHSSIPRSTHRTHGVDPRSGDKKSPFYSGLHDILCGLFGHGERVPSVEELSKLADDFGDLIVNELVARLVLELKNGLLEKLLIQYLKEMVTGAVRKKVAGGGIIDKGKGTEGKSKKNDGENWKKGLLKKAAVTMVQKFAR